MIGFIMLHPAVFTIGAYWVFSAVVGGMPEPTPTSSPAYVWAHNSLHILAGNLSNAVAVRYPALSVPPGTAVEHKETQITTVLTPQC
jgi:hypothetical protein